MLWFAIVALAFIYIVNTVLAFLQTKNYTSAFTTLRRRGRVAIGKKKGVFRSGAIVMLLLDENGTITDGARLTGVTVLSRFRPFGAFTGMRLADLDATGDRRMTTSVRQAVNNARDNYLFSLTGSVPPEPPGPLSRLIDLTGRRLGRPARTRTVAEALAGAPSVTAPAPTKKRVPMPS